MALTSVRICGGILIVVCWLYYAVVVLMDKVTGLKYLMGSFMYESASSALVIQVPLRGYVWLLPFFCKIDYP